MKFLSLSSMQTFLSRLSKREKTVMYTAAIIISLTLLDRLIVFPIFSKITELSEDIDDRSAGIKKCLHMLAHRDRILAASIKYKTFVSAARSEEEEMTSLLKEIETLGSESSIYLVDMKPGDLKETGTANKYMLNINCEAQLQQLVQFMYNIEKSPALLTIEKYKISPKAKDSSVARCSMSVAKIVIP